MGDIFVTNHELTRPREGGHCYGDFSVEQLRQLSTALTEEEQASAFSKFYYEPMGDLESAHIDAIQRAVPLKLAECFMPQEAGKRMLSLQEGTAKNGYGVLENGIGFAVITITQAGITDEMIRNYRENFAPVGDSFYKTWYPGAHLMHYKNGAVENFGYGMLNMEFRQQEFVFAHIGIKESEILQLDPSCIALIGSGARASRVDDPNQQDMLSMVIHTRITKQGREMRVCYWNGLTFDLNGDYLYQIEEDQAVTEQKMYQMMCHCMKEYRNEYRLICDFWNQREHFQL